MSKTSGKKHPDDFYLIPWSVGYECRTKEPDGFSIHVKPVVPGSVTITRNTLEHLIDMAEPRNHPQFDAYERARRILSEQT